MTTPTRPDPRPQPSFAPLFALTAAMAALAVVLVLAWLADLQPLEGAPTHLDLWVLIAGFVIGESLSVTLETREEAHQLNFVEVVYVLGLLFGSPSDLVVARVVGGIIVLGIVKRQSLHKLLANVSMFSLEAAACVLVYRALLGDLDPVGALGWLVVAVSIAAAYVVSSLGATLAIASLTGWPGRQVLVHVFGIGGVLALANAAIGLGVATSIWERTGVGYLFLGVVVVLYGFNRAFTRLKERFRNLATLHDFTRTLGSAVEIQDLEREVIAGARSILRGEHGALLLQPVREGAPATRLIAAGEAYQRSSISPTELAADLAILLPAGTPRLYTAGEPLPGWLSELGVKDAAIVPLVTDGVASGAVVVANRMTEFQEFVPEDLHVFETLASHANVALANGRLVAQLQHEAKEQEYLALHDPITGLPNRTSLSSQLERAIQRAKASERGAALVYIDLETFKEVNDTLGAATGDRLLQDVRQRVQALLPAHATLARLSGDQMAVLLPAIDGVEEVLELAESVHTDFDTPFTSGPVSLVLGASIGIALYPEHAPSAELLFQRADAATYLARLEGSGIEVYSADNDPYAPRRLALAAELQEALAKDEVDVYVQPKVSLTEGIVVGAEALVRWTHPRLGPLSPDAFIPAAEHTGVIRALTIYVVRNALQQCRKWRDAGMDLTISVNLSARNLFDSHLVQDIGAAVQEAGVPASVLTLELTESTVMSESRRSMAVLEGLQELGAGLSVDDFGTGYSSLSHLRQLPITELKVDKSFVSTMTTNDHDAVIVRALVDLGRSLGLRTVAEGVESSEAWDMLREMDCDEAQGYLLSRPLPAEQFVAWLGRQRVRRIDHGDEVVPFVRDRRSGSSDA